MKKRTFMILTLIFTLCFSSVVYASEGNVDNYGLISLIPPLVAILLAFLTKNVIISLFVAIISGTFILSFQNTNFIASLLASFSNFINLIIGALSDPWNAGIIMQVLVIGGVIELITKMGGAKAVAEKLTKYAKTPVSAQIIAWLMGLLLFFDDYANALIVGPIMRPIFDKLKISREKLAFIVDSTAAPIAGIALVSTWIGLEIGLIQDGFASSGIKVDGYNIFIQTIPYRFYNIYMLIFVLVSAITLREFGSMYTAEMASRKKIDNIEDTENPIEVSSNAPKEGIELSTWNAIIPISTLIIGSLFTFYYSGYSYVLNNGTPKEAHLLVTSPLSLRSLAIAFGRADASVALLESALLASVVAIGIAVIRKIFTLAEALETWIRGMEKLLVTGLILILAWALGDVIELLGVADFLIVNLSDSIPVQLLPTIIFILSSIISFSIGSAYGTLTIIMPLAIPMAIAMNTSDLSFAILSASAVLAGAIFGDHCSPISDTTILSSTGSSCPHLDHVKTQVLYAITVFFVSIVFGYLPAGFGIPLYIIMPLGVLAIITIFFVFGRKIK